jgi:hypothetical protein
VQGAAARRVPRLAAANSTMGVAKESHPFRNASPTEKCNKSSSLVFDGLFDWTSGEPTYLSGLPVDGGAPSRRMLPGAKG